MPKSAQKETKVPMRRTPLFGSLIKLPFRFKSSLRRKISLPKLRFGLAELLIVMGMVAIGYWGIHRYIHYRSLELNQALVAQYQTKETTRLSAPSKLTIGTVITTQIQDTVLDTKNQWVISPTNANHIAQSANPGEPGNIIIYGHNAKSILGNLRWLVGNESITITSQDNTVHYYKITGVYEVDPDQVEFLKPTTSEVLTIYTCSGLLDSKRFILRAEPIQ